MTGPTLRTDSLPRFGPFRVLHQVGAGSSVPYFARTTRLEGRLVALKAFRLDLTPERAARARRSARRPSPPAASTTRRLPRRLPPGSKGHRRGSRRRTCRPSRSTRAAAVRTPPLADALAIVTPAGRRARLRRRGRRAARRAASARRARRAGDDVRVIDLGVAAALERVGLRAPVRRPYAAPERIEGRARSRAPRTSSRSAPSRSSCVTGQRVTGAGDDAGRGAAARSPARTAEALVETFCVRLVRGARRAVHDGARLRRGAQACARPRRRRTPRRRSSAEARRRTRPGSGGLDGAGRTRLPTAIAGRRSRSHVLTPPVRVRAGASRRRAAKAPRRGRGPTAPDDAVAHR